MTLSEGYLDDNEYFHWVRKDDHLIIHLGTDITSVTFRIPLDYERVDAFIESLQEWAQ